MCGRELRLVFGVRLCASRVSHELRRSGYRLSVLYGLWGTCFGSYRCAHRLRSGDGGRLLGYRDEEKDQLQEDLSSYTAVHKAARGGRERPTPGTATFCTTTGGVTLSGYALWTQPYWAVLVVHRFSQLLRRRFHRARRSAPKLGNASKPELSLCGNK